MTRKILRFVNDVCCSSPLLAHVFAFVSRVFRCEGLLELARRFSAGDWLLNQRLRVCVTKRARERERESVSLIFHYRHKVDVCTIPSFVQIDVAAMAYGALLLWQKN